MSYRAVLQILLLLALVVGRRCLDTSPVTWRVWVLGMLHSTVIAMATGSLSRSWGLRLHWFSPGSLPVLALLLPLLP